MAISSDGLGPTSHSFFSQRLRLHYVDYGHPDAPLVVLVHGGRDHARSWDATAVTLREHFHVVAPDLRGHGDSAWAIGSQYAMPDYLLDLHQLLRHLDKTPVMLVGHSLGGAIVLQYTGIYPDRISRVVAIEGLGPPPSMIVDKPVEERLSEWIQTTEGLAARQPRRYASIALAEARMREANSRLSPELVRHLTKQGVMRMEDGTYTWKFDNYVRAWGPNRYDRESVERLWGRIACPALLIRGAESWAENPVADGRTRNFQDATYLEVEGAGHWVHHDRHDIFMHELTQFLQAER
ncbi:MAG: alpha/beta hydrolase [Myxococcales bacterium]|nr:MAG: alpha/beta hydrolase [Myxococcales bacterium]